MTSPARWCALPVRALLILVALAAAAAAQDDSEALAQRRQKVRQMTASEFDRVRRNYRKFQSLDSAEQNRLRRLHTSIEKHPDRAQLVAVMRSYHRWVRSLSPADRDQLLSTPPEARMDKLRELLKRQPPRRAQGGLAGRGPFSRGRGALPRMRRPFGGRRGRGRRFARPATTGLFAWLRERVEARLDEHQAEQLAQLPAGRWERLNLILHFAQKQQLLAGTQPLSPDKLPAAELRSLVDRLPKEDRDRLKQMTPTDQRSWLGWQLRLSVLRVSRWSPLEEDPPLVDNAELQAFKTNEMPSNHDIWGYIDALDPVLYKRELTRLYLMAHPEARPAVARPAHSSQPGQSPQ